MNKPQVKKLFTILEKEFKSIVLPEWTKLPERIWEFDVKTTEDADEILNKVGSFIGLGFVVKEFTKEEFIDELNRIKGPLILYYKRNIYIYTLSSKGLICTVVGSDNVTDSIITKDTYDFTLDLIKENKVEILVPFKTQTGFSLYGNKNATPWMRFWNFITGESQTVIYLYVYAVVVGIISLSLPLGIQSVIGLISGGMLFDSVIVLIAIVIVGVGITGGLQILQIYMVELLQRRMFVKAALEFSYRIPHIKSSEIKKFYLPELVNRFYDVVIIQKGLPKILLDISAALFLFIFGIILLALYHFSFLAISLVLLVSIFLLIRGTAKKALDYCNMESKYKHETVIWLERLSKGRNYYNAGPSFHGHMVKTDTIVGEYLKYRSKHFKVLMTQIAGLTIFKLLLTTITLIVGSVLVVSNQVTLGQFVAAEIVIILMIGATEKLISNVDVIYDVLIAFKKVGDVTDLELNFPYGVKPFLNEKTTLKVVLPDKSTYEISKGEHKRLEINDRKKLNLILTTFIVDNANEKVQLQLNGIPAKNYDLGALNQMIYGITVMDKVTRGSLFENVSLLLPNIDSKEILEALSKCDLNKWISELEDGIDASIEPNEILLQPKIFVRLMAARILIHKPEFIITDDIYDKSDPEFASYFNDLIKKELPDSAHLSVNYAK